MEIPPKASSKIEENRFVISLKENVPLVEVRLRRIGLRDERVAAGRFYRTEHRIGRVSGFIAKVNARNQAIQQSTHENRNQNMWRLLRRCFCVESTWLDRSKPKLTILIGRNPAKSNK